LGVELYMKTGMDDGLQLAAASHFSQRKLKWGILSIADEGMRSRPGFSQEAPPFYRFPVHSRTLAPKADNVPDLPSLAGLRNRFVLRRLH
jgi:hypothetical protein